MDPPLGLTSSRYIMLEENVAMFFETIYVLYKRNSAIEFDFLRSSETVRNYFIDVLNIVLRLQGIRLKAREPIPANSTDVCMS